MTLNNIVFTGKQIDDAFEQLPNKSSILIDESINVALSTESQNKMAIQIVKKLTQIRKKGFSIFVCFPYLHKINSYFISRCIGSIYVYAKGFDKQDRGYFRFYSALRTQLLYDYMKNIYKYNWRKAFRVVQPNFSGKFNDFFPVDYNKYDAKKDAARTEDEIDTYKEMSIKLLWYLSSKEKDKSVPGCAKFIGRSKQWLYTLRNQSKVISLGDIITTPEREEENNELEVLPNE